MGHCTFLRRLTVIALMVSFMTPMAIYAQSFYALRRERNFMVNFGSGTAHYHGDMVDPGELGPLRPNISGGAEMYLTSRISVRAELTWFQVAGNDAKANDDRVERNLSFRSNNLELAALGVINLTPNGLRFYERSQLNFHLFAGVAGLWFNPTARSGIDGKRHALQPLETENKKYSRIQPVIPFGIGARIKLNPYFNILVEGGYRWTFTDHLDDISRSRYVAVELLNHKDNPIAVELSDRRVGENKPSRPSVVGRRGNPDENDGYFIANITLQYYLPNLVFADMYRKLYSVKRKSYYRRPGKR